MTQTLYTNSLEDTTITLTNGGASSDEKLLINRDLRVKGLDVSAGTSTVTVEWEYSSSTVVEYAILGNFLSDDLNDVDLDYFDGTWQQITTDNIQGANSHHLLYTQGNSGTSTQFRLQFDRTSSTQIELACIFTGVLYTAPVNYDLNNTWASQVPNETIVDAYGYPYSQNLSPTLVTTVRRLWDVTYGFSKSQLQAFESEIDNVGYNQKPFFLKDTLVDSNLRLVRLADPVLYATQPGADYFKMNLRLIEI